MEDADEIMLAAVESFIDDFSATRGGPLTLCTDSSPGPDSDPDTGKKEFDLHPDSWETSNWEDLQASSPSSASTADSGSKDQRDKTIEPSQEAMDHRRQISNAKAAIRRTRYRQRIKREREVLITQVSELSAELSKRQVARRESDMKQTQSLALCAWKAIATLQKEKRYLSQEQQLQLQAAVLNNSKLIHQMKAFLVECNQPERNSVPDGATGDILLNDFVRELGSLYAQTNNVFHGMDLIDKVHPLEYGPVTKSYGGVQYVEFAEVAEIGHSFEQASRGFSFIMLASMGDCNYKAPTSDPDNICAEKYCMTWASKSSTPILNSLAVRRFQEDDRLVFVWRALLEGQGEFEGHHADETGWFVLRPSPTSSSHSILTTYSRLVPTQIGKPSGNASAARFMDAVLRAEEAEFEEMSKVFEEMAIKS